MRKLPTQSNLKVALATGAVIALAGCSAPGMVVEYQADYPSYSEKGLVAGAEIVVEGVALTREYTVLMPRYEGGDPESDPLFGQSDAEKERAAKADGGVVASLVKFRVNRSYRGSLERGQEISVLQTGGMIDGIEYRLEAEPPLASNMEYLLFASAGRRGAFAILGGSAGMYSGSGPDSFVPANPDLAPFQILSRSDVEDLVRR